MNLTAMAANLDLSEIVRVHRATANLSRADLALLAGVGKTVVFDIENGKQTIRLETLLKVLTALNISIQYDSPLLKELSK